MSKKIPRTRLFVMVLSLAAGSLLVVLTLRGLGTKSADAAQRSHVEQELSTLRERLDAVAKETRKPAVVIQTRAVESEYQEQTEPSDADEPPTMPAESAVDKAEIDRRRAVMRAERSKLVEEIFESEPVDSAWSYAATKQLMGAFQGEEFAAATFTANCKSTICRVDIKSQNPTEGEQVWRKMTSSAPWPGSATTAFSRTTGEGYIYFAREGMKLPTVEPSEFGL